MQQWLCDVMNVMHSNRCIVSIWNARYRHQPRLFRKIYFIVWTIYKLWKTNEHTILKLWTLIKNIIERTLKYPYNILFTFLMDRGRAPNGISHLMILKTKWHWCQVTVPIVCRTQKWGRFVFTLNHNQWSSMYQSKHQSCFSSTRSGHDVLFLELFDSKFRYSSWHKTHEIQPFPWVGFLYLIFFLEPQPASWCGATQTELLRAYVQEHHVNRSCSDAFSTLPLAAFVWAIQYNDFAISLSFYNQVRYLSVVLVLSSLCCISFVAC